MNKEYLDKLSNEELKAKYKSASAVLQVSLVLFVIYVTYMIYSLITGNWEFNISSGVVVLLFVAVMVPNNVLRKQLKEELQKRGNP
jgi:membrane protein YdbS with pleckstrin-like domain